MICSTLVSLYYCCISQSHPRLESLDLISRRIDSSRTQLHRSPEPLYHNPLAGPVIFGRRRNRLRRQNGWRSPEMLVEHICPR